ncbi:MAG TPA: demethoxyubiquinone hydroxylase family protein [Burkholderiaceae bacterium]|jgi:ubiquinone biosynthesis monooxygenase Coq7
MITELSAAPDTDLGTRILKVNHAGENGAVHIYTAQALVARLTAPSLVPELLAFKSHEEGHRAIFWTELQRRGRPKCRSYALCGIGGFVLGFMTALMGRAAIAATTVAVERVVLRHLRDQIERLGESDASAVRAIQAIFAEEQQHHDQAAEHATQRGVWLHLLQPVVSLSTETVIWLGMKL